MHQPGSCRTGESLVQAFEACTLPFSEWTHEAHLKVALWYLSHHPRDEATSMIRDGIQRYNASHGVEQTLEGGYHETITLAYVALIWEYLKVSPGGVDPLQALGDKQLLLQFYQRDTLMSWAARTGWVAPDKRPLEGFFESSANRPPCL